jgi:hypothetical protein
VLLIKCREELTPNNTMFLYEFSLSFADGGRGRAFDCSTRGVAPQDAQRKQSRCQVRHAFGSVLVILTHPLAAACYLAQMCV